MRRSATPGRASPAFHVLAAGETFARWRLKTIRTATALQDETNNPQRLDRLPWSSWHSKMVIALGITWLLDGLEVTLAGSLANVLKDKHTLGLTDPQVDASATGYLAGAVVGALFFGWLTDRRGRKRLFLITLALYLSATAATAISWELSSFLLFRVLTGAGIGGEYAAINSAIDETGAGRGGSVPFPRALLSVLN